MADERMLTTTSYAILGMLSIQPWSTYALTQQMQRSLHYLWPRAESNVYAEPKRLVEAGLATAEVQATGKRERTIYHITDAGREELRRWLSQVSAPSRFESEILLKVLFAHEGTKDELLATVQAMADEAMAAKAFCLAVAHEYARGQDPFPERSHLNALIFRWIWDQAEMKARWAAWATDYIAQWEDMADVDRELAREPFREILRESYGS